MALSATTVWEVQSGGSDLNGGAFYPVAGGSDYSQVGATPHVAFDGTTIYWTAAGAGLTIKIYGYTVATTDKGNSLRVPAPGDANQTAGVYCIASVVTGAEGTQSWTLVGAGNVSSGAVTAGTGRMGGSLATPGILPAGMVSGNTAWIKAGTYTFTTSTPGSGGPVVFGDGAFVLRGYTATRGDGGMATIDCGAQTSVLALTMPSVNNGQINLAENLLLDGKSGSGNNGFLGHTLHTHVVNCRATGFNAAATNYGFKKANCYKCKADACGLGFAEVTSSWCTATGCTDGFSDGTQRDCISYANSRDGYKTPYPAINCTAYGNAGIGFSLTANNNTVMHCNCLSVGNTSYGYSVSTYHGLKNCAHYGNSAGINGTPGLEIGTISLTGNPFINAAVANFRLNMTAGAGAACRSAGVGFYDLTGNPSVGGAFDSPVWPAAGEVWENAACTEFGPTGVDYTPTRKDCLVGKAVTSSGNYGDPDDWKVGTLIVAAQTDHLYKAGGAYYGITGSLENGTYYPPNDGDGVSDVAQVIVGGKFGVANAEEGTAAGGGGVSVRYGGALRGA